ncbi:hypothetical protein EDB80DRAFT_881462 [Ilyonectria destructans]|nr:hypothetical protein EDB80DRAFT_881462 [Ilyonectria destructans]
MAWTIPLSIRSQFTNTNHSALSTEEKLQLAYLVGSSLLYLHFTPWLENSWHSGNIYLPGRSNGEVVIEPLLAKRRNDGCALEASHGPHETGAISTPIITSFGRFLIELCLGAPCGQINNVFLGGDEPFHASDVDALIFTHILGWVENLKVVARDKPCHLEGNSYFDAIRGWFRGNSSPELSNWTVYNTEFRLGAYKDILRPLQFALEDFQARQIEPFRPLITAVGEGFSPNDSEEQMSPFMLFGYGGVKGGKVQEDVSVKDANTWFLNYDLAISKLISRQRPELPQNRIRVAVLDTGVDALERAVQEKEVHIISLSFGFPNVDQSLEPIRPAILKAHAADVPIFAAAGNKGKGYPISFPACMDEVISVGSTDGNSKASDFVPTLQPGKRLCAIGEGINAAWISEGKRSDSTMAQKAGTSYATSVAASVAAMIVDFVRSRWSGSGGSRTCPGRHLVELAISKVIPALVEEREIEASATASRIFDISNVFHHASVLSDLTAYSPELAKALSNHMLAHIYHERQTFG